MGATRSMFKTLKRSSKGARVPHEKETAGMATVKMAVPAHVFIPMQMHIGAPAEPVVKKGDQVCVGTPVSYTHLFVDRLCYLRQILSGVDSCLYGNSVR